MDANCIFCKIVNKEVDAEIVYENKEILAFKDIYPATPVHLLIIPRKHIPTLADLEANDAELMGRLHLVANDLARAFKVEQHGYRVVINCGKDAGQVVFHLHLHLLGGRPLRQTMTEGRGV